MTNQNHLSLKPHLNSTHQHTHLCPQGSKFRGWWRHAIFITQSWVCSSFLVSLWAFLQVSRFLPFSSLYQFLSSLFLFFFHCPFLASFTDRRDLQWRLHLWRRSDVPDLLRQRKHATQMHSDSTSECHVEGTPAPTWVSCLVAEKIRRRTWMMFLVVWIVIRLKVWHSTSTHGWQPTIPSQGQASHLLVQPTRKIPSRTSFRWVFDSDISVSCSGHSHVISDLLFCPSISFFPLTKHSLIPPRRMRPGWAKAISSWLSCKVPCDLTKVPSNTKPPNTEKKILK